MELRQYAAIIWRWLWLILLSTALAAGTAYVVSIHTIPVYQASTTLLVNEAKDVVSDYTAILTSERLARTYAELLRKRPVLEEAINRLGTNLTVEELAKMIEIRSVRDTQLIMLTVEDISPIRAASIANEIPRVFAEQNEEMQTRRFAASKANLAQQLENIQADIARTQQAITNSQNPASLDQTKLDRLRQDLAELQNSYAMLLKSYEDVRLTEAKQLDTLIVVEPAQPPTRPVRPRTPLNTLLAAVVGAMLALGAVFLLEYLDDTVKTPEDVTRISNTSTLGAVAWIRGHSDEDRYLFQMGARSSVAEAYRALRTSISFAGVDRPIRTLLVTSPGPGEGKSTTAVNLSYILAQAGMRVLLVDGDLRRPSLHKAFNLPNNAGLTTLLLSPTASLDEIAWATSVENLWVVTSGLIPPNPSELLGSHRMKDLVTHLGERMDIVVFDTPPVLAVTDPVALAPHTDGVLLVLEAGGTREPALRQTIEELSKVDARLLGVVLNKLQVSKAHGYYYYYYHYDYYYSDDGQHGDSDRRYRRKEHVNPLIKVARQALSYMIPNRRDQ